MPPRNRNCGCRRGTRGPCSAPCCKTRCSTFSGDAKGPSTSGSKASFFRRDGAVSSRPKPTAGPRPYRIDHVRPRAAAAISDGLIFRRARAGAALRLGYASEGQGASAGSISGSRRGRSSPATPFALDRPLQNWNFMCADCHSTAVRKIDARKMRSQRPFPKSASAADPATARRPAPCRLGECRTRSRRRSKVSPPSQGSAAVDWTPIRRRKPVRRRKADRRRRTETCGRCHVRRSQFDADMAAGPTADGSLSPGLPHARPVRGRRQMKDEVFNLSSFQPEQDVREGRLVQRLPRSAQRQAEAPTAHGSAASAMRPNASRRRPIPDKDGRNQPRLHLGHAGAHLHGRRSAPTTASACRVQISLSPSAPNACNGATRTDRRPGRPKRWSGHARRARVFQTYARAFHATQSPTTRALFGGRARKTNAAAGADRDNDPQSRRAVRPRCRCVDRRCARRSRTDGAHRRSAQRRAPATAGTLAARQSASRRSDRAVRLEAVSTLAEGPPPGARKPSARHSTNDGRICRGRTLHRRSRRARTNLGNFFSRRGDAVARKRISRHRARAARAALRSPISIAPRDAGRRRTSAARDRDDRSRRPPPCVTRWASPWSARRNMPKRSTC